MSDGALSRYVRRETIAVGGAKTIQRVFDLRTRRHLALALCRAQAPTEVREAFIREAWLTSMLDHSNTIAVHDVGVDEEGHPYFTMDLKHGISLDGLIEKLRAGDVEFASFSGIDVMLEIFLKICDALAYAHSLDVLHLDLKPANIQVGRHGEVVVCDWGLGCLTGDGQSLEALTGSDCSHLRWAPVLFGEGKGTPGYMAPEQFDEDARVDQRTDVYGLGGILYSMLTLRRPVKNPQIGRKQRPEAIVPPGARDPLRGIPPELDAIAMRALQVDPVRRYATVRQMRDDVQRFLDGYAPEAEQAGVLKQLVLFYRRNRLLCLALMGSGILTSVLAIWSFQQVREKMRMAVAASRDAARQLELYRSVAYETSVMNWRVADSVVLLSRLHLINRKYALAKELLSDALEADPNEPRYLRSMGMLYFVEQQFEQAISFLKKGGQRGDRYHKLANRFAALKTKARLDPVHMVELLQALGNKGLVGLMLVLWDSDHGRPMAERPQIIEAYLRCLNPDWTAGEFSFDPASRRLRVSGSGLKRLSLQRSVLALLQPRILDLSGSGVDDLRMEADAQIEMLDLRGTPFRDFQRLKHFGQLREVIVDKGQIAPEQRMKLPPRIKVRELSEATDAPFGSS